MTGFIEVSPRGFRRFVDAVPTWLTSRLWVRSEIERELDTSAPIRFARHHESHAAAAYGPSPFAEAAVLTIDGVGEWTTNGLWHARSNEIEPLFEIRYPDSIGLLYSTITAYCGFRVNDGEYKLMGLAPYGEPRYADAILDHVLDLTEDGSYRLDQEYFSYTWRDTMASPALWQLLGGEPRTDGPLTARHADVARSIQAVVEEVLLRQARFAREQTGARALCLAGGVALNCVANGRLAREGIFDDLWIQPAAGDAGGSVGAAYAVWLREGAPARDVAPAEGQSGSLLGPSFSDDEMRAAIEGSGLPFERLDDETLVDRAAAALADREALGWFEGRMEFGPRALGNRSILADARDPAMQSRVNRAIKFRESFRPFAPIVRAELADAWFDLRCPSPYMLLVGPVRNATPLADPGALLTAAAGMSGIESPIPAVTHVDGSARVQTVGVGSHPRIERLLERFEALTGCPVLLNTSFNVKDEPIVCTPDDALGCFERTGLDRLVMGPFLVGNRPEGSERPEEALPRVRRAPWRAALDAGGGALGFALLTWVLSVPALGVVALCLGLTMAAVRLGRPDWAERVDAGLGRLGRGVARALAFPVLGVVFVTLIVPAGAWSRLRAGEGPAKKVGWLTPEHPEHDLTRPH